LHEVAELIRECAVVAVASQEERRDAPKMSRRQTRCGFFKVFVTIFFICDFANAKQVWSLPHWIGFAL
jgi:hypothetical protein